VCATCVAWAVDNHSVYAPRNGAVLPVPPLLLRWHIGRIRLVVRVITSRQRRRTRAHSANRYTNVSIVLSHDCAATAYCRVRQRDVHSERSLPIVHTGHRQRHSIVHSRPTVCVPHRGQAYAHAGCASSFDQRGRAGLMDQQSTSRSTSVPPASLSLNGSQTSPMPRRPSPGGLNCKRARVTARGQLYF
jgi:hypothetical protein